MASKISEKETIELLDDFLALQGLWNHFVDFIEDKGYTKEELNMETE